jgi:pimeloyl-ACP methyl ester carboxylesterase
MPRVKTNNIEIEYETFGDPSSRPLLLIMGLGAQARKSVVAAFDRSNYPPGYSRQLAAILATGNRKQALASITAPTLVIHGSDDPLIPPEGGKDTAEAIPEAELLIIEGMGHSLPIDVWPKVVDTITKNASKAYL